MDTLYALDLTTRRDTDSFWRSSRAQPAHRSSDSPRPKLPPDLPGDGFASPFGFWFAPAPSWKTPPQFRVEFVATETIDPPQHPGDDPAGQTRARGPAAGLRQKASTVRDRATASSFPFQLDIDSNVAQINVDIETWLFIGETVLFAVAQYWRFAVIHRKLAELSDWSRLDLAAHSRFFSLIERARARELRDHRRTLQAIILDLPAVEGPLTNPRAHRLSAQTPELYRALCRRLGLVRTRREIDEQVEVVETVLDSLSESLDHCESLAFQVALELIIVAVLLLDFALYFVNAFAG